MSDILKMITPAWLPEDQYINEKVEKDQVFVHHTASSANPFGVMEYWAGTSERVSTAFIIAGKPGKSTKWKDGDIIQCFSSAKWSWHLGLKASHLVKGGRSSRDMNAKSIGIEICNWGQLTLKNGKYYSYAGTVVPETEIVTYPIAYKGYKHYHKYTDAQLENTRQLIRYLCNTYDIPSEFKGMEMFNIDRRCLMGEPGIWTHTSCRPDKFDCHPQPEMIQMLESI